MSQLLRVIMMPWLYIEDDILNKEKTEALSLDQQVKDIIDANPEFVDYAQKTYSGKVYFPYSSSNSYTDFDEFFLNCAPFAKSFDNLYHLSSIICHSGSLNQGHYYCLSNRLCS